MALSVLKCLLSVYLIASPQNTPVASQPNIDVPPSQNPGNIAMLPPPEPGPMNPGGFLGYDFDVAVVDNDTLMIGTYPIGDQVFKLEKSEEHLAWVKVINIAHTTIGSIGFTANMMTIVTIFRHGNEFSMAMRVLLTHQALVDGLACAMATAMSIEPEMFWKVNYFFIDYILCVFWHSEAIYWAVILVSIWNLVLIAVERYVAVIYTFASVNRKHIVGIFVVVYLFLALDLNVSGFIRTTYYNGKCGVAIFPTFTYYWSITNLFVFYLIPTVCFLVLYGRIVYTLRNRKRQGSAGQADVFDAASATLLRMAIAVTSVFAVAIGYAQWYFTLVFTETIAYGARSPQERAAIVLNTCNVVANPFVYGFMLPAFRRSLKKTFGCVFVWQKCNVDSTTETTPQRSPDVDFETPSGNNDVSINVENTYF